MVEVQEGASTGDWEDSVDLLLKDPSHNTSCNTKRINSEHDHLKVADMASVAEIWKQVLSNSGHGRILCYIMQFWECYKNWYAIG